MIKKGQVYKFDTSMVRDRLPDIPPVLIRLTVSEVNEEEKILRFVPSLYEAGYVDAGVQMVFDWFRFTLPHLKDNCLNYPSDFESFVQSGGAKLIADPE
jgi:hypothetical protein